MIGPLLLDTHVAVDLVLERPLSVRARRAAEKAAENERLMISAMSIYEIAWLLARRRIRPARGTDAKQWIERAVSGARLQVMPISQQVAIEAALLGWDHGDPADRIIAATARLEDATLVTRDQKLLDYGEAGGIKTLEP